MANPDQVKQWIEIANFDFATAKHVAATMYPIPFAIVCYHCQQAVEKYLKAFLVFNDVEPPKIHNLTETEPNLVIPMKCKLKKQIWKKLLSTHKK